jgi:hypothetical protein
MERLLKIIEKGDPEEILSEENLYPKFNELLKYGFVEIKDDKVFLTAKGELAKLEGVEQAVRREKRKHYLDSQKIEEDKRSWFKKLVDVPKRKRYIISFLLLFLTIIPILINLKSQIRIKLRK